MARKKANYPLIEGLEITTLAAEGKAMGRYNDVVVFVPMTVPGDVVDVQIRSKRRRYMEGFVVNYVKRSPLREEPFCGPFRGLRRLQVAESALRRTTAFQDRAGARPACPHR